MPVRIYDIAKKLGIESKEVLARARELGITTARVPSSSLDKITAAYLEEQLGGPQPPPPAPEAPPAPAEPVILVTAPPEPPPPVVEPPPPPPEIEIPVAAPSVAPEPEPAPPLSTTAAPVPTESPAAAPAAAPVEAAPIAPVPSVPEAPPSPPPPPPPPKIGDKVGFINLPQRLLPKSPPAKTPIKPTPPPPRLPGRFGGAPGPARPGARTAAETRGSAQPAAPAMPRFVPPATGEIITLKPPIVVRDLAELLKRKPFQLIADLMELNVFATVNQAIEEPIAQRICAKYGFRFEVEKRERGGGTIHAPKPKVEEPDAEEKLESLKLRPPVVTIMGHVDHGKTTLLDVIRNSNVVDREAGRITQHIGAYTISIPHPERKKDLQQITFLDTPGHAAFSSMRARGANVTDIVVLVVAANDGVMPQTLEALSHAQAARVSVMVAVNKCDHPNANPMKVRQQLQEKGLVCEEWGGNTIFVDLSALTRQGVDKLLEMLVLQAEVMELKANPDRLAKGNVIESGLEPGGPTATVLVRQGTLRLGDMVLCGPYHGKVRALINEEGKRLKEAGPSVAVKLLGLDGVPEAGHEFRVIENEKAAREAAQTRQVEDRSKAVKADDNRGQIDINALFPKDDIKILQVVIKGDTQGSVEAIVEALNKITAAKVQLHILHSAVGTITNTDVLLAAASKTKNSRAVILGFHTRIDPGVADAAKQQGVQIKLYTIIYELIDEVQDAMAGLLDPIIKEATVGSAEVRKIFALSKGGNVAGCVITNGRIVKGKMRVYRRKNLLFEGPSASLRRFQDEVNEVRSGMECGIRLDGFNDFEIGDVIECFSFEKVAQKLS